MYQQIQDFALAVDRPPQPLVLAVDRENHLVEMPLIARLLSLGAQVPRKLSPELQDPASDRLVRNVQAAFGQEFLDVAVAERETQIEPDGMADDVRREAVAGI